MYYFMSYIARVLLICELYDVEQSISVTGRAMVSEHVLHLPDEPYLALDHSTARRLDKYNTFLYSKTLLDIGMSPIVAVNTSAVLFFLITMSYYNFFIKLIYSSVRMIMCKIIFMMTLPGKVRGYLIYKKEEVIYEYERCCAV